MHRTTSPATSAPIRRGPPGPPATSAAPDPVVLPWPENLIAAVARLGRMALEGADPAELMRHAADDLATTIGADLASVEHLLADGPALLLVAGAGWRGGSLRPSRAPRRPRPPAAARAAPARAPPLPGP